MTACGLQAVVYKGYVALVLKRMMDFLAYGRGVILSGRHTISSFHSIIHQKKAFFLGCFTEKTYFCTIIEENYNKKAE